MICYNKKYNYQLFTALNVVSTYVDLNSTDKLNIAIIRQKNKKLMIKNASHYKLFTFPSELDSCDD